jgi:SNF2 family DNA or RNA helicase
MRKCELEANKLSLSFSYNPDLVSGIKELPPYCRKWNPKNKNWVINLDVSNPTYIAHQVYDFLLENAFTIFDSAKDKLNQYLPESKLVMEDDNSYVESSSTEAEIEIDCLQMELRPFQKAGVRYLSKHKKSFLADEMGLGKTAQAISVIQYIDAKPCLVLCPVSLQRNWQKEISKWLGEWCTISLTPNRDVDFNIIPYSQVKKYYDVISCIPYKSMICDESHYLKNGKAQRTKLIKKVSKKIENVYMLSGTPIVNRPNELIAPLEIMNMLEEMGGWNYFVKEYCGAYRDRFGLNISGARNLKTLNTELRKRCYIRRQKKDVLKELPEKQRTMVDMEIENWSAYNNAEAEVVRKLEELSEDYENTAHNVCMAIEHYSDLSSARDYLLSEINKPSHVVLSKLEQIKSKNELIEYAADYFLKKSDNVANAQALMLLNELKKVCAEEKINSVTQWIHDFMENGEKLIVFAEHINIQKELIKRLNDYNPCAILGEMDGLERHRNVECFQNSDNRRIIICSLQAAGVGLTLTSASNVAFVQCGWTPAGQDQAEDRAHRIGQENAVTCYYLLCPNTIDEDIWSLIEEKREVVDKASDGLSGSVDINKIIKSVQNRITQ